MTNSTKIQEIDSRELAERLIRNALEIYIKWRKKPENRALNDNEIIERLISNIGHLS